MNLNSSSLFHRPIRVLSRVHCNGWVLSCSSAQTFWLLKGTSNHCVDRNAIENVTFISRHTLCMKVCLRLLLDGARRDLRSRFSAEYERIQFVWNQLAFKNTLPTMTRADLPPLLRTSWAPWWGWTRASLALRTLEITKIVKVQCQNGDSN